MPTYEYQCTKCQHEFEVFQSMTAKVIKKCPKCGKTVKRLMGTGSGIIFKGSGFYATDYRKPAPKNEAGGPACPSSSPACGNCPKAA